MILKYRPEIDGLRAVAVLAVIIYHANLIFQGKNILSGGFIGVDVFFVISGYLITSIILKETSQGTFRLRNFYIRRVRRILPILFTVMLASLTFAWLYMMPDEVKEYAGSVLSSLSFVSNIYFWQEDSYWAVESKLKPFLHTWSLSVEEQFYIFYPVIILLLLKYVPKHMFAVLVAGFFSSLILAHLGSIHFSSASFYLLPMRGWELLAGGILAKLELDRSRENPPLLDLIMPKIAMVLILGSFFLFDNETRHPSLLTLFPVIGSMLLIWFCNKGELITKILSSRAFVGVGLLSYGLYIWHYPIFAFAQIKDSNPSLPDQISWIVISFILATFTYFTIEKPGRNFGIISTRKLILCLAAALTLIAGTTGYAYLNQGLWGRFQDWQVKFMNVQNEGGLSFSEYVTSGYDEHRALSFPENSSKKRLAIIGDSYSQDVFNILQEGGFLNDIDVITYYIPARCQNVRSNADYQKHIKPEDTETCRDVYRIGHPALNKVISEADMIIVTAAWDDFTTPELPALYAELKKQSKGEALIIGRKEFYEMKMQDILSIRSQKDVTSLKKSTLDPEHYPNVKLAAHVMKDIENYIDLHKMICSESQECPVSTPNGFSISYDGGHLTQEGAAYVAQLLRADKKFMRKWNAVF